MPADLIDPVNIAHTDQARRGSGLWQWQHTRGLIADIQLSVGHRDNSRYRNGPIGTAVSGPLFREKA